MKINTDYFESLEILLSALQYSGLGSAIIGGGAIRDALAGKPIADIDVFYDVSEVLDVDSIYFKSKLKLEPVATVAEYDSSEFWVTHVLTTTIATLNKPIQLIATKTAPMDWISKFPHSISRCALGKQGLVIPVECLSDFHKKRMFVYDNPNLNEAYLNKIKSKYHDWEFLT